MSFLEIPDTKSLYIVYTKSNCVYCDKIKGLMDYSNENVNYISCDHWLSTNRTLFLNVMRIKIQKDTITFPIVFFEGKYIGGCNEYEMKIKNNVSSEILEFTLNTEE